MRRVLLAAMAMIGIQSGIGCNHVGGKCDCGPQPGDATTYAPSSSVMLTHPPATTPVITADGVTTKGPMLKTVPSTYEGIGLPASLPKK